MSTFPEHAGPDPAHRRPIGRVRARLRILAYLRLAVLLRRRLGGE